MGIIRLVVLGRNSDVMEPALGKALADVPIDFCIRGILPAEQVLRHLAECDVLLFVRGGISTRRGSAIAGIACGLPVVAFAGPETAPPITEAGVVLTNHENPRELGEALLHVLTDARHRDALAERSRHAYTAYFSWKAIAERYVELLRSGE